LREEMNYLDETGLQKFQIINQELVREQLPYPFGVGRRVTA